MTPSHAIASHVAELARHQPAGIAVYIDANGTVFYSTSDTHPQGFNTFRLVGVYSADANPAQIADDIFATQEASCSP